MSRNDFLSACLTTAVARTCLLGGTFSRGLPVVGGTLPRSLPLRGDTRGFNAQLRLTDDPDGSTAHCFLATYQSQALSERAEALRTRSSSAVLAERVRCVAALCIYPGAGGPPCQL